VYDQYGDEGLRKGVPARSGIPYFYSPNPQKLKSELVDFEGFEGGYQFHGNADVVFNEFFGGNNPFSGKISTRN
jgi:DnaJ family protein B protein 13